MQSGRVFTTACCVQRFKRARRQPDRKRAQQQEAGSGRLASGLGSKKLIASVRGFDADRTQGAPSAGRLPSSGGTSRTIASEARQQPAAMAEHEPAGTI